MYTSCESFYAKDDKAKLEDETELKKVCAFIKDNSIPRFISDWHTIKPYACSNSDITRQLHSYGINLRYMGSIVSLLESKKEFQYLSMVLTRSIFVRSLKHYINEILRGCGSGDVHVT